MKSERRHDLQSNELAHTLGSGIEKAQPFAQYIVGAVVIAAVLAMGWGVYSSFSKKNAAAAWTEYYFTLNTGDAEAFKAIASDHPGSAAAIWAEQTAGDEYLSDGIDALYKDRAQGVELLKKAITSYETVKDKSQNAELRARAELGMAQAHESLGEIEKAKALYQKVIAAGLQPAITTVATNRVAFLNSPAGKEFYTWFDKLKPSPALPPKMPGDLSVPPTSPNLKFDPVDTSKLELPKATATPADTATAAPQGADGKTIELPKTEPTTPPATETPAAPATETPAPAAEVPATTPAAPTGTEQSATESAPATPAVEDPSAPK